MSTGPFIYPQVNRIPEKEIAVPNERNRVPVKEGDSEFDKMLAQNVSANLQTPSRNLEGVRQPLKFSSHAAQRLQDRKITLDPATLAKVNNAVDRVAAKGVDEALILTKDYAFIVGVKNRTVITALDKGSLADNVFTNIDGAIVV